MVLAPLHAFGSLWVLFFGTPRNLSINAFGNVPLRGFLTGGTSSEGLFVDSGGTDTAVTLEGDSAPGTGGGTYSCFLSPSINFASDVAFFGCVTGGTVSSGIFKAVPVAASAPTLGAIGQMVAALALAITGALAALRNSCPHPGDLRPRK